MSYNHNARKVVIDGPQPIPDANPWLSLDTPMTYAADRVLYVVPGGAIVGIPGAYRPHPELTAQKNIWIPQGGETVTGYITIKDAAGALRKLAVVS